jgi:thiosulfate/3-mercaptopyruvate sulfurtransferase
VRRLLRRRRWLRVKRRQSFQPLLFYNQHRSFLNLDETFSLKGKRTMSWFIGFLLLITSADEGKPERYPRADLLLEVAELSKPEVAERFRILDARTREQYLDGHIPDAIWVDHDEWSKSFAKDQDAGRWQKLIGGLGITAESRVVLYDDHSTNRAARVWWILRFWGLRDVKLLNGGWKSWIGAHGPITQGIPKVEPAKVKLTPHPERLATKVQLLQSLPKHEFQMVDARSESEYCGEANTAKRNGAIPGALHKEWNEAIDKKTQRFKSPDDLAKLFKDAGIDLNRPSVTYCQSGGRAAVMAFTLELMGAKSVRNYYKSWSEWGNAEDTPIEKPKMK